MTTGDLDGADAAARRALSAAGAGAARTWLPLGCTAGALVAVSRDDLETAEQLISAGMEQVAAAGGVHVVTLLLRRTKGVWGSSEVGRPMRGRPS